MQKYLVRLVQYEDLNDIQVLASSNNNWLSTNLEHITKQINVAIETAKQQTMTPIDGQYLFVVEDLLLHRVVGVSSIKVIAEKLEPFIVYAKNVEKIKWQKLSADNEYMYLKRPYNTYVEICEPFIAKNYQAKKLEELLLKSMFLFMRLFSSRFPDTIIAIIRGALNKNGNSYFWDGCHGKMLPTSFQDATLMRILYGRAFDIHVVPKHPIYLGLLSSQARTQVGKINNAAKGFCKNLQMEKFVATEYFDVFDAGTILAANRSSVKTINTSKLLSITEISHAIPNGREKIICNNAQSFKALQGKVIVEKDSVRITEDMAEQLQVQSDDSCLIS